MKNKELIEKLSRFPLDKEVVVDCEADYDGERYQMDEEIVDIIMHSEIIYLSTRM